MLRRLPLVSETTYYMVAVVYHVLSLSLLNVIICMVTLSAQECYHSLNHCCDIIQLIIYLVRLQGDYFLAIIASYFIILIKSNILNLFSV